MSDDEDSPLTTPNPSRSLIYKIDREGQVLLPGNHYSPTPASIGLSTTRTCTDANSVLAVVAPYFQERFALSDSQTASLRTQLEFYFIQCGITNEEMLSVMTSPDSWPKPQQLAMDASPLNLVTVPVTLLLSQIAKYTGRILHESCYLTTGVTFSSLSGWITSCDEFSNTSDTVKSSPGTSNKSDGNKIPISRVPRFTGDTLAGDTYIEAIDNVF